MSESEKRKSIVEEIEVAGGQLVDQVKRLIREGNVRQLKIAAQDGDFSLEVPMTFGVIAGGAVALTAPWLAVLGVIAAMVAKVKLEVERDAPADPAPPPAPAEKTDA
jgi:hypothetical protein